VLLVKDEGRAVMLTPCRAETARHPRSRSPAENADSHGLGHHHGHGCEATVNSDGVLARGRLPQPVGARCCCGPVDTLLDEASPAMAGHKAAGFCWKRDARSSNLPRLLTFPAVDHSYKWAGHTALQWTIRTSGTTVMGLGPGLAWGVNGPA
jgi:hypothetical protein